MHKSASEYKEFRSQIIKNPNPSKKYKKKWLHNTLAKLGIDSTLFIQYGFNNSLYNIIADYLIGFPTVEKARNKDVSWYDTVCYICGKKWTYLIALFSHYNNHYYCNVCQSCVSQIMNMYTTTFECKYGRIKRDADLEIASIRNHNSTKKDMLIKRGFKNLLLWLGLIDFTLFTNIYIEKHW